MTDGFAFDPAEMTVSAGSTVTFTNDSDAPHTVTAYSEGVPEGEYFSSGGFGTEAEARDGLAEALVEGDGTFRVTLDEPGTYRYFCIPHEGQGMKGTITVE